MHFIEQIPSVATIGGSTLRVAATADGSWTLVVSAGSAGATLVLVHEGCAQEYDGLVRKWLLPRPELAVRLYDEVRHALAGLSEQAPMGTVLQRLPQRVSPPLHHPRAERRSRFDRRGA